MLDSGASTLFLNKHFVDKHKVTTRKLAKPIEVFNIDGTPNKAGMITEVAVLNLEVGEHKEKAVFTVTDIGPEDVIIGINWLRKYNPSIDWYEGIVVMDGCPDGYQSKVKLVESKLAPRGDTEVWLTASHGKSEKQQVKPKKRWSDGQIQWNPWTWIANPYWQTVTDSLQWLATLQSWHLQKICLNL